MFKCRIQRKGNLEIYMQSVEVEEVMRQLHTSNPRFTSAPNRDYVWNIGECYRAPSDDGGNTWKRDKRIAGGTPHLRTDTWIGALDRIRPVIGGQFTDGGQLVPSGQLNLWPLMLKELATGFVIVNPEPMSTQQLQKYAEMLDSAIQNLLAMVKPVDITVSFTKKPAVAPA